MPTPPLWSSSWYLSWRARWSVGGSGKLTILCSSVRTWGGGAASYCLIVWVVLNLTLALRGFRGRVSGSADQDPFGARPDSFLNRADLLVDRMTE